jgi:diguanylate cyclase (GGDEF)-like protein
MNAEAAHARMDRILSLLRAEEYFTVGASPRFRAVERRLTWQASRAAMLVIALGVPLHVLALGALHPRDIGFIILVDGGLGAFSLAAWWSLGRFLRHWPEAVTFVLSLAVSGASILLAVTGPRMVELAICYLVFIPPLVALVVPWRSWTEVRWLAVYGFAAIAFFAGVAPDGPLTVTDRLDLIVALLVTLGAALIGHILLFRRHVRTFVQVQALGRLQRRETQQRSELQRVYRSLEVTARTDELTGAGNRLKLHEDLKAARSRLARTGNRFGLLEVDLDHFKAVNDAFGHLAGDEVLRRVSKSLRDSLRAGDSVYRYGGEEFLVLLADVSGGVLEVGERIRAAIECLGLIHPSNPPRDFVTVSVGAAAIGPADLEATNDDWFARVDVALYQAKAGGRNRVSVAASTTGTTAGRSRRVRPAPAPRPLPAEQVP